jgi:hypothetical protein
MKNEMTKGMSSHTEYLNTKVTSIEDHCLTVKLEEMSINSAPEGLL